MSKNQVKVVYIDTTSDDSKPYEPTRHIVHGLSQTLAYAVNSKGKRKFYLNDKRMTDQKANCAGLTSIVRKLVELAERDDPDSDSYTLPALDAILSSYKAMRDSVQRGKAQFDPEGV